MRQVVRHGAAATLLALGVAACGDRGAAANAAREAARRDSVEKAQLATTEAKGCAAARASGGDTAVRAIPVNRGTHGMIARTRWLASPDGCALLVVEDPAAVEAEPITNGALLVSEREARPLVIAIDSVWDAMPDASWRTLAYGRGWVLSAGERDTVPPAKWEALARATGADPKQLEARAFNASGMAYARGVALAYVRPIAEGASPRPIGFGGWRVRWRGDTLFVGDAPVNAQDHAEPTAWTMHTAPDWQAVQVPPDFAPGPERWAEGPMIQLGVETDSTLGALRMLDLAGGRAAQSRGGQVYVLTPGQPPRAIGTGALLAATLGGRFVVAIRPTPNPTPRDPALQLVVYDVP